jgi:hypothetical protein
MLRRSGSTEAAIRSLERAYALTEHPAMATVHEAIGRRLAALEANGLRQAADAAAKAVDEQWQGELPFVSRDEYMLLGPSVDPLRCTGLEGADDPSCARDWRDPAVP